MYCSICAEPLNANHKCPPVFLVATEDVLGYLEEYGDCPEFTDRVWHEIRARDARTAAERMIKKMVDPTPQEGVHRVRVRNEKGIELRLSVSCEWEMAYNASPILAQTQEEQEAVGTFDQVHHAMLCYEFARETEEQMNQCFAEFKERLKK